MNRGRCAESIRRPRRPRRPRRHPLSGSRRSLCAASASPKGGKRGFPSPFPAPSLLRLHRGVTLNNQETNTLSTLYTLQNANEFTGKRVLVTGGTKGIGEATVNRLLRGGATVLATARNVPAGHGLELIQADGSTRSGADHIIQTVLDRFGGLDSRKRVRHRRRQYPDRLSGLRRLRPWTIRSPGMGGRWAGGQEPIPRTVGPG